MASQLCRLLRFSAVASSTTRHIFKTPLAKHKGLVSACNIRFQGTSSQPSESPVSDSKPISRFPIPDRKGLPADIQQVMDEVEEKSGFLPNVFKALSYHPNTFRAFFSYYDILMEDRGNVTKADKELIIVATSSENNCLYCVVAHSALLRLFSKNPILADQVSVNWRVADIDDRQRAILELAMAVCKSEPITEDHFISLEAQGLDRQDAFDIGHVAGYFALSNRLASLTNVRPNDEFFMLGRIPKDKETQ